MQQKSNLPGKIKLWIASNKDDIKTKFIPQNQGEKFEADGTTKKRMTKRASTTKSKRLTKPRPYQPMKDRRVQRNKKVAHAKRSAERQKLRVITPPTSKKKFTPGKASTPKFTQEQLDNMREWFKDPDDSD